MQAPSTDALAVNTLRALIMDAVEAANSGHPGAALALAPLGWSLFRYGLRFDPSEPTWFNRDRFVLSCGHASMLQYGLLHLSGYDLSIEDLKAFRQLGSKTPGHPEYRDTPGVEVTTGPLGQGIATAVGMALGQRQLAARFSSSLVSNNIVVLASDGDLMEGVAYEAAALAGHLKLKQLLVFWDDNRITIDGGTDKSTSEDVLARFKAQGWGTESIEDAEDLAGLRTRIEALGARQAPTLVRVRTTIAYPAPNKQNTSASHGAPLGSDEVQATKQAMGWTHPAFHVPEEVAALRTEFQQRGAALRQAWEAELQRYEGESAEGAAALKSIARGELPRVDWAAVDAKLTLPEKPTASRKVSGEVLQAVAATLPGLVGGSADLAGSNNTYLKGLPDFGPEADAAAPRNLHFGIREHAMAAACNGMALFGGLRPYAATFLIFSDYMRPSIRLAALMKLPVTYVFTHDSIGLGEDGPTHQPVEQLASLRAIPGLTVIRPADARETAGAWKSALEAEGPVAIVLSRQNLAALEGSRTEAVDQGAYVVQDAADAQLALLGTGSEVAVCLEAAAQLAAQGLHARVISVPSWERFEAQPEAYKAEVLPKTLRKRIAVEAASPFGWSAFVGPEGRVIGMQGFGASGPAPALFAHFRIHAAAVVEAATELLEG